MTQRRRKLGSYQLVRAPSPEQGRSRLVGAGGAIAGAGMLALAVIGNYEGLRLYVYRDVIGVYTYCYGETKNARMHVGERFTKAACDVIFIESLQKYEREMRGCLKDPDALPDKTYVSYLSLAYNIGGGGFCKSSIARDANSLHLRRSCDDFMKYTRGGGRVLSGLVARRKQERKLCLEGLASQKQE